jgi:hypothetical protein
MSQTPPGRIALPPPLTTADFSSAVLTDDSPAPSPSYPFSPASSSAPYPTGSVPLPKHRRSSYRPSFSTVGRSRSRRASRASRFGVPIDDDDLFEEDAQPKLPTLVPGIRPAYSTPLPTLPMVVLCIVRPRPRPRLY